MLECFDVNEAPGIDVLVHQVKELLGACTSSKHSQGKDLTDARESIDYVRTDLFQGRAAGSLATTRVRVQQSHATDCYRTIVVIHTHRASSPQRSFENGRPGASEGYPRRPRRAIPLIEYTQGIVVCQELSTLFCGMRRGWPRTTLAGERSPGRTAGRKAALERRPPGRMLLDHWRSYSESLAPERQASGGLRVGKQKTRPPQSCGRAQRR